MSVSFYVVRVYICEDTYIGEGSKSISQFESESDYRGKELVEGGGMGGGDGGGGG